MNLIDTHSHLFLNEFTADLNEVIDRAKSVGIIKVFMPNIDSSTIEPMMRLVSEYKNYCLPMIGLHPTSVNAEYEKELEIVENLLIGSDIFKAIGEVGIDLYWDKAFLNEQVAAFDRQVRWALEFDLPLVIHSRDSLKEICGIMERYGKEKTSGIFHSFTGTLEDAERLLEYEHFKLGINGVVTFKNSSLPDVLRKIPLERIVLETDSPYLTPVPNRGRRNESANLKDTLIKVSEIYRMSQEDIAQITTKNALEVFKMEETIS